MSVGPKVSVLLPVYNAAPYVGAAMESMLAQTLADLEVVAVDDGSTDASREILERYAREDKRVRVISRPNTGLVGALNDGLIVAGGLFVARMDADDLSLPDRLQKQVEYLEQHPKTVAVGCRVMFTDPDGLPLRCMMDSLGHREIEAELLRGRQAMVGAAVIMRREAVMAAGGYRQKYNTLEDLDLLLRLGEQGELVNLPETLYHYRQRFGSICRTQWAQQQRVVDALLAEAHARRALPFRPEQVSRVAPCGSTVQERRKWAWWALRSGFAASARKHAVASWLRAPWSPDSWRLMYCTLRGH